MQIGMKAEEAVMRHFKTFWRMFLLILGLWIVGKFAGCVLMTQGPWGPEVRGRLPDGGHVIFQSRSVGRETDDRLSWIDKDGTRQDFWVDQCHCGFSYVTIKLREDSKGVWVESDGKVGSSLDLITGEFRFEHAVQFEWAQYGEGKVIAEGRTWGIWTILHP